MIDTQVVTCVVSAVTLKLSLKHFFEKSGMIKCEHASRRSSAMRWYMKDSIIMIMMEHAF